MKKLFFALVLFLVVLSACSSGAPSQPASSAPAAPPAAPEPPKATATPVPVPSNIPIMQGATELKVTEADITYIVKSDLNKVIEFYSKEMPAKGWREQEKPTALGLFGRMYYATPDQQASFFLTYSEPLNQVQVRLTIMSLNVANPTPGK
ncbi:MAG: hypothetical protein FJ009_10675 [Chloroflexi bacterium]|nr:hypothetical protein [Chloroflexota bacterium]